VTINNRKKEKCCEFNEALKDIYVWYGEQEKEQEQEQEVGVEVEVEVEKHWVFEFVLDPKEAHKRTNEKS